MVGWFCVIGWQSGITAIAFLISNSIQGLIAFTHPDYTWAQWHGTLLAIGVVSLAVAINICAPARVPQIEGIVVIFRSVGIAAILIVLWVLAPKNNAHDAFLQFRNNSGWSLDGLAFMVGLPNLALSLLGFDSMVHMCKSSSFDILPRR
jgi:choline transport protein